MTITSKELDRVVVIQRATTASNAFNELVETWADLITVRARRRDVSDGEKFAAGMVGSHLSARFMIRSSVAAKDVTPADRLVHDGATWNIHGTKEAKEGRHRFIEITAIRRTDLDETS